MAHLVSIPERRWRAEGPLLVSPLLARANGLVHGFTTRLLGDVKSEPAARDAILRLSGGNRLRLLAQVHGVRLVPPGDADERPEADGWCGRPAPGLLLGVMAADCLPLLLFHEPTSSLAVVHAGWRGAAAGIASAAVRALCVPPGELLAALGPAIGPCCYEVGPEVAEAAARHPDSLVPTENGKYRFDLAGFVRADLEGAGVGPHRIDVSGLCTSCTDALFFSHRRDGGPGRACAFAGVRA